MAFTATYAGLQTEIATWLARDDLTSYIPNMITMGEAYLNRELPAIEADTTLTGTLDSRRIDITSLSMVEPVALFLAASGEDEIPILPKPDGTFAYLTTSGVPKFYAIDANDTAIDFDCPLDSAYPFRFRYRARFALSVSATTNWLLTTHPDVYLAASLSFAGAFVKNFQYADMFSRMLSESIRSIKHTVAKGKRGRVVVDEAIIACDPIYTGEID